MFTYDIKSLLNSLFPASLPIWVLRIQIPSLRPPKSKRSLFCLDFSLSLLIMIIVFTRYCSRC